MKGREWFVKWMEEVGRKGAEAVAWRESGGGGVRREASCSGASIYMGKGRGGNE